MSGTEQLFESDDDAYDEFDCENNDEEENEGIVVKEEEDDLENDSDAIEIDDEDYEAVSGEWAVGGFIYYFV